MGVTVLVELRSRKEGTGHISIICTLRWGLGRVLFGGVEFFVKNESLSVLIWNICDQD